VIEGVTAPRWPRRGRVVAADTQPNLLDLINERTDVANYLTHPSAETVIEKRGNTAVGRKKAREDIAEAIRTEGKQLIAVMLDTAGKSMKCHGYGGSVQPRHVGDVDGCLNDGTSCICRCHDPVAA
jgi:hypothetical protein